MIWVDVRESRGRSRQAKRGTSEREVDGGEKEEFRENGT